MPEHELEKLLGGFAANTLTPEERQALFTAALQDQQLFNALADEQALKELLSDPATRQRILAALEHSTAAGAAPAPRANPSWLGSLIEWFQRPANLALAGGLATAVVAIVLGTRIYQDSLKQVADSTTTEEAKAPGPAQPTPPSPVPRQEVSRQNQDRSASETTPAPAAAAKQQVPSSSVAPIPKTALPREQDTEKDKGPVPSSAPAQALKEETASALSRETDSKQNSIPQSAERQIARKQDKLIQDAGRAAAKSEEPTKPSVVVPHPSEPSPAAPSPFASALPTKPSARTLFYATEPAAEQERRSRVGRAEEKSSGAGALTDAPQKEMKRAERSAGLLGKPEGAKTSTLHPLGLRYSLIMAGPGGIDLEVDPTTPVGKDDAPHLTVEANEDGYLSVLYQEQSGTRTMLFPSTLPSSEREATRIVHRKRYLISLAGLFTNQPPAGELRLVLLFSRAPQPGVSIPTPADKHNQHLMVETIDPSQPGSPQEQAVYVINPAPSPSASILVEVPLTVR